MKIRLILALVMLLAVPAFAQTQIVGTERLGWAHDGINVDRFEILVDLAAPVTLTVTQTGTEYRAPLPALTPGTHTLGVRACNVAGCSSPMVITVRVVVVPGMVTNLRVVP